MLWMSFEVALGLRYDLTSGDIRKANALRAQMFFDLLLGLKPRQYVDCYCTEMLELFSSRHW